jgi:exosortase H (IPTLxxWG-CTERM-specific)
LSLAKDMDAKEKFDRIWAFVRRHRVAIRSALLFVALLTVWTIWYPRIVDSHALNGFLVFNAQLTGSVLNLFGANVQVSDTLITSSQFSMRIGHECTAIVPMVLLICAAIAYPSRITQKLICLAIGLPVLFVLNLARTASLYHIGINIPDFFDTAHFIVWQSVMILAVVIMWLFWVSKVVNVRSA